MIIIPQELLDLFIDFIDESFDGQQAMLACMLVCKAFFLRARSYLFERVDLDDSDGDHSVSRIKNFKALLEYHNWNYPPLGSYIRTLALLFDASVFSPGSRHGGALILIDILCLLADETYNIRNLIMRFHLTDFPNSSPDSKVYRALLGICSLPTLQTLGIHAVNHFPLEMINISQLREIDCERATFRSPSHYAIRRKTPARLRKLEWVFGYAIPSEWSQDPTTSPLSNIQSLTATFSIVRLNNFRPDLGFNTILSLSKHTLENLKIYIATFMLMGYPHSLQHLTALRTLTYGVFARTSITRSSKTFDWATEPILQSLATVQDIPPSLTRIILYFGGPYMDMGPNPANFGFSDKQTCKTLLDELASPRYASVAQISLVLHVADNYEADAEVPFLTEFPGETRNTYGSRFDVIVRRGEGVALVNDWLTRV